VCAMSCGRWHSMRRGPPLKKRNKAMDKLVYKLQVGGVVHVYVSIWCVGLCVERWACDGCLRL
jgi:hypothetical protein